MNNRTQVSSLAILGLSSCKKEWICECTTETPIVGPVVTQNEIDSKMLRNAEKECEKIDDAAGSASTCRLIGFK